MVVVKDTELTWGDTMDSVFGMYLESGFRHLFKRARKVFGGMTDLKSNVMDGRKVLRQPMHIVNEEGLFIGCIWGIAV